MFIGIFSWNIGENINNINIPFDYKKQIIQILNKKASILKIAKKTIKTESRAIENLSNLLDDNFADAVSLIYSSKGRVIITGIGKSAIIASKIVATLNSTGTPSVFMHAADAIHGDLGLILEDDVVIFISKSGNTPEIKVLVPLIKNGPNKMIAITGNTASFLGQNADFVLNTFEYFQLYVSMIHQTTFLNLVPCRNLKYNLLPELHLFLLRLLIEQNNS